MVMLETSPTPADLAYSGDLMAKLGQTDAAERQYRLAEAAWRSDAPEPSRLARFLAEHGRRLDEAMAARQPNLRWRGMTGAQTPCPD